MSADTPSRESEPPGAASRESDLSRVAAGRRGRAELTYVAVERRLLCERIAQLERELERERGRREDVVEQYERLLREREETSGNGGLLSGLLGT